MGNAGRYFDFGINASKAFFEDDEEINVHPLRVRGDKLEFFEVIDGMFQCGSDLSMVSVLCTKSIVIMQPDRRRVPIAGCSSLESTTSISCQ